MFITKRIGICLTGLFLCVLVANAAPPQVGTFRGFNIGRYEGEAFNTTGNAKGKAVFEIKTIDRTSGVVTALFEASQGLSGKSTLTGSIDANGSMLLSGALSEWTMRVAARVNGNIVTAQYRLEGSRPQAGSFTVALSTARDNVRGSESVATTTIPGSGLLSREAILQHLRTNLGTDRRNWQRQNPVNKELIEAVKQRGVDFKYDIVRDSGALQDVGADSDLRAAIRNNPGIPAKVGFLFGTWNTTIVGQSQHTSGGVTTVSASGVRSGFLIVNPDRTYVWNVSPTEISRGTWRNATSPEMQNNGGQGVVFLAAYGGYDWLLMKNNDVQAGDEVIISRVDMRASYFFGQRSK